MVIEVWTLCFIALIITWFLLTCLIKNPDRKVIVFILLIAILLRFLLSASLYGISIYRGEEGAFMGRDDLIFLERGRELSDHWQMNSFLTLPGYGIWTDKLSLHAYNYMCAAANFLFGQYDLPALLCLNILIGSLAMLPTYTLGYNWGGPKVGKLAAIIVAVHPSTIFWSSLNFRDCYILLIFTSVAATLSQYLRDGALRNLWKSLFYGSLLVLFRFYFGYLVLLVTILIFYVKSRSIFVRNKTVAGHVLSLFLMGLLIFSAGYPIYNFINEKFSQVSLIQLRTVESMADEGSITAAMVGLKPIERLLRVPFGMVTTFIAPFPPWNFSEDEVHNIFAALNFFWLPFLGFLGWAAWRLYRDDRWQIYLMSLLIFIMILPGVYASFVGSPRAINPGYGIFMAMIALAIYRCRKKVEVLFLTGGVLIFGSFLYYYLHG